MHHTTIRRALAVLIVTTLALGAVAGVAFAGARESGAADRSRAGWPWDHQPEADPPLPADAEKAPPAQPEGMTDEEFAIADPEAYAILIPECRVIEKQLRERRSGRGASGSDEVGAAGGSLSFAATTAPYSPYGYLRFLLVPGTGSMTYNGYRGTLYFRYGYYVSTIDAYRWYTVAYPAISGNNLPWYQSVRNVGPIPEYTWDFGFLYGSYRGFEYDYRTSFYPGKWRLDPWTGGPYGRGYFEVHGGTGDRYFKPTAGCIRLTPTSINSLRWYHANRMSNRYDRTCAHVYVDY